MEYNEALVKASRTQRGWKGINEEGCDKNDSQT